MRNPGMFAPMLRLRTACFFRQNGKHGLDLPVPLVPVMSARNLVEFMANVAALQTGSEFAVSRQQAFQRPACQIKIRNFCVINRFHKSEWIVLPTGITAVPPKSLSKRRDCSSP